MKRRFQTGLGILLAALALSGTAQAANANYVIEGGSPEAQSTVRAALDASRFDFNRVPAQITIRISKCGCAGARSSRPWTGTRRSSSPGSIVPIWLCST